MASRAREKVANGALIRPVALSSPSVATKNPSSAASEAMVARPAAAPGFAPCLAVDPRSAETAPLFGRSGPGALLRSALPQPTTMCNVAASADQRVIGIRSPFRRARLQLPDQENPAGR